MARLRAERSNAAAERRYAEVAQQLRRPSPDDDPEAVAKARGAAVDRQLAALEEAQRASRMEEARAKFAKLNAKLSPEQRLSNLMGALADDVEEMTDEQLLAEAKEAGVDITGSVDRIRRMVADADEAGAPPGEVTGHKLARDRLIAAIRAFTVDAEDDAGNPIPNGSKHEAAIEELCRHRYMLDAPLHIGRLFEQAMLAQADDCQELREAAEAYFGGDFRGETHWRPDADERLDELEKSGRAFSLLDVAAAAVEVDHEQ
jgi:hypothetical protein